MPSWACPYRRTSLLKSFASMILCVGWCFIMGFNFGMRFRSFGCDGMYRFMM